MWQRSVTFVRFLDKKRIIFSYLVIVAILSVEWLPYVSEILS